ncbi:MAG: glycosyltransferase [Nocardioidaceae bacterium]
MEDLRSCDFDVVLLQRPRELELVQSWTGRRPGVDIGAIYVEHNTPGGAFPSTRHALADQSGIPIAHVTAFNELFWDCGAARTTVIDHGIIDPGQRYTGEIPHAAIAVNDPVRRGRAVGSDLLPALSAAAPLDVFGMGVSGLGESLSLGAERLRCFEDLPQHELHTELARRRVYVHTSRWTSLGLSLLEAMHLGMPVVVLATTEAVMAVPPDAGVISTRVDDLAGAITRFLEEPERAHAAGRRARQSALARYGLKRFLADWDELLSSTT